MERYNGWTNYETWNWNLWITNEEGAYNYWLERAAEAKDAAELAAELEADSEEMLEGIDFPTAGPLTDILNAGLSVINWSEIANSLIEAAKDAA